VAFTNIQTKQSNVSNKHEVLKSFATFRLPTYFENNARNPELYNGFFHI